MHFVDRLTMTIIDAKRQTGQMLDAVVVPFKPARGGSKSQNFLFKGEAAWRERMTVASRLTVDKVKAMRGKLDLRTFVEKMKQLAAAGYAACPDSGFPVFDPTLLGEDMTRSLWEALCTVAKLTKSDTPANRTAFESACNALAQSATCTGNSGTSHSGDSTATGNPNRN